MLKARETQSLPFPPVLSRAIISATGVAFPFLPSFLFISCLVFAPSSVPVQVLSCSLALGRQIQP